MAKINIRDRNKGTGKKPNWEYRFEAAKIGGKRQHISKSGFRTKKEAQEAGASALAEYNNAGEVFRYGEDSFQDLIDKWFEHAERNFRVSTLQSYRSCIKTHILPRLGKYKVKSIKPEMIEKLIEDVKSSEKRYSSTIIKQVGNILRKVFSYAVYPLGWIKVNPATNVNVAIPTDRDGIRTALTKEEFDVVIKDPLVIERYETVLKIAWLTGMRIGEILGLTWDCVDMENRTLHVNKQLLAPEKKLIEEYSVDFFGELKTKESERTIIFGDTLYEVLKKEKAKQERCKTFHDDLYKVNVIRQVVSKNGETRRYFERKYLKDVLPGEEIADFVCKDIEGNYISRPALHYLRNRLKKLYNIEFGYHKMRHSHATMLFDAGVNAKEVQARLGHATIATTMDIYTHISEDKAREAADAFEKLVSEGGQTVDKK